MMAPNTVSVIVPTYNRRELLRQSLDSVFRQTHWPLEVVVVDDGSTDGTGAIADEVSRQGRESGVSLVWLRQENRGVSAARNRGLAASGGEFIVFHDSDDLLDPERLARQVAKLQATGADLCAASLHRFIPGGSIVSRYTPDAKSNDCLTPVEIKKMHWGTPMFMYRRAALGSVRWDESIACAEDIDFNFRILEQGVRVCVEPLAVTRIREHADGVKLQNRSGGMEAYWLVHARMLRHYRDRNMAEHLALEQATLLRTVVALHASGARDEARRRFRDIQPFAPGVVSGGLGERLALQLKSCGWFCRIRMLNNRWGGAGK